MKYVKNISPSKAIRELKIKTTLVFHFTLVRMSKKNKITNNKCWRRNGEMGKNGNHSIFTVDGIRNWIIATFKISMDNTSKAKTKYTA